MPVGRGRRLLRFRRSLLALLAVLTGLTALATTPLAAPVAAVEASELELTRVIRGLGDVTALDVAPDGTVFVTSQDGTIRLIRDGFLIPQPFAEIDVAVGGTDGLLGIVVDPDFDTNGYVYVYYTTDVPTLHNRVARLTASGDVVDPESPIALIDLPTTTAAAVNHHGGDLAIDADGYLLVSVGDGNNAANGALPSNPFGTILRLGTDGTIPEDNPWAAVNDGTAKAVWAHGFRNPFKIDVDPFTGDVWVNDVGAQTWEEVNLVTAGGNFGWPAEEGVPTGAGSVAPTFTYPHTGGTLTGCAITGSSVYRPTTAAIPDIVGHLVIADFCGDEPFDGGSWIRALDPATSQTQLLNRGLPAVVDLATADDGSIYVLSRGVGGSVYRLAPIVADAPVIDRQPADSQTVSGDDAGFSVGVVAPGAVTYQWYVNGAPVGSNGPNLTLPGVTAALDGAIITVDVTNTAGTVRSNDVSLRVTGLGEPPTVTIDSPTPGTTYAGGDLFDLQITTSDPEDGTLDPATILWKAEFHHDLHSHPFIPWTRLSDSSTIEIPRTGETETNVFYRIDVEVIDSDGLRANATVDLLPRLSTFTVDTSPSGLTLDLDGRPITTPLAVEAVEGTERTLSAPGVVRLAGQDLDFGGWSDSPDADRSLQVPVDDVTYTATFAPPSATERVYTETWIPHASFTGECGADVPGSPEIEVGPCTKVLAFDLPADPASAGGAEVFVDLFRNGDIPRAQLEFNHPDDNPGAGVTPIVVRPDVGFDDSRSPWTGVVPLDQLVEGTNTVRVSSATGDPVRVLDVAVRLIHDADGLIGTGDLSAPDGRLLDISAGGVTLAPATGGDLVVDDEQVVLTAEVDDPDTTLVEFLARYDGFDVDNDGVVVEWHEHNRNNHNPGGTTPRVVGGTIGHVGTVTVAPWQITWDTARIPTQREVSFGVRLSDAAGNVREFAGGPSAEHDLFRTTHTVSAYRPATFADGTLGFPDSPSGIVHQIDLPEGGALEALWLQGLYLANPFVKVNVEHKERVFDNPGTVTGDTWRLSNAEIPVSAVTPGVVTMLFTPNATQQHLLEHPGPTLIARRAGGGRQSAPTITAGPVVVDVPGETGVVLEVMAASTTAPRFVWRRNGRIVEGAAEARLVIDPERAPGTYVAEAHNAAGVAVSDGFVVTSSATRVDDGLLALWDFVDGSGTTVTDEVGGLDLTIEDPANTTWGLDGLTLDQPTRLSPAGSPAGLQATMSTNNQFTVEAWITTSSTDQDGPARIISLSDSATTRNLTIGQGTFGEAPTDVIDVRLRTRFSDDNGIPSYTTPAGSLTTARHHVVVTRGVQGPTRTYIDGVLSAERAGGGDITTWDSSFALALGNEVGAERPWLGTYHLVAIYDRELSSVGVQRNFAAGLTLPAPPTIVTPPTSQTTVLGAGVTFSVAAAGDGTLTYQWNRDGVPIPGATSDSVTLTDLTFDDDATSYTVTVSNRAGSVTTAPVILIVTAPTGPGLPDGRTDDGLVALWSFASGVGATAIDHVGDLDLTLAGTFVRQAGGGLAVDSGTTITSGPLGSLTDAFVSGGDYTVEMWVDADEFDGSTLFSIGTGTTVDLDLRSGLGTGARIGDVNIGVRTTDGYSRLVSSSSSSTDLMHVAVRRLNNLFTQLYVNGVRVAQRSNSGVSQWDPSAIVRLGNEPSGATPFTGVLWMAAVHETALSPAQIAEHAAAGRPDGGDAPPPNQAPTITNPGDQTTTIATTVELTITATDPDGDTITYSTTGLPPGLNINTTTGTITGTPTTTGTYTPTITIDDGELSADTTLTWTITPPPNQAPTITNPGDQTTTTGTTVELTITATDPDGDTITYSTTGLPPGLNINTTTGTITGTPTTTGTYTPTITIDDGELSADTTLTWTITPPGPGLPAGRFDDGLVGLWSFASGAGSTVTDHAGNADLTITGTPNWLPDGGLALDGTNTITSSPLTDAVTAINNSPTGYTIEAWVDPDTLDASTIATLTQGAVINLDLRTGLGTGNRSNDINVATRTTDAYRRLTISDTATTDLVHIAVRRLNNLYTSVYINGQRIGVRSHTGPTNWQPDTILTLGNLPDGTNPLTGTLWMFAIHTTPLTEAHIATHHTLGPPQPTDGGGDPDPDPDPDPDDPGLPAGRFDDGLVGLWSFASGAGSTVTDHAGNADLTITGTPNWLPDGGLALDGTNTITSSPLTDAVTAINNSSTGYTIEAWVDPDTLDASTIATLTQGAVINLDLRTGLGTGNRSNDINAATRTTDSYRRLTISDTATTDLVHIAVRRLNNLYTFVYINGQRIGVRSHTGPTNWQPDTILTLGNLPDGTNPLTGTLWMFAIHTTPLTEAHIATHHTLGPPLP